MDVNIQRQNNHLGFCQYLSIYTTEGKIYIGNQCMIEENGNDRNTFENRECEHLNKILKIQGSKEVAFELDY